MNKLNDNLRDALCLDTLLHAYGIEGDIVINTKQLSSILKHNLGVEITGNPDFHMLAYESMGIKEARGLLLASSVKSFTGGGSFFIIAARSLTREAQNALLKLFEDPAEGVRFFLLVPSFENLLPTLKSRLFLLSGISINNDNTESSHFIEASFKERFKIIKPFIDNKDKKGAIIFLNNLESFLHNELKKDENRNQQIVRALHDIEKVRGYLDDRSPSLKMLLEYVALSVPKC